MDELTAAKTCFGKDYAAARKLFLRAAKAAGATVKSYPNPLRGPNREQLATDTVWLGPKAARNVLVLISGTHGVEGFCGSGCQVDWLRSARDLPRGTAMLLVHAINPYGFAWLRRVTEDGVDLNRNFVDFAKKLPTNPGYDALAGAILPKRLSGPIYKAAQKKLEAYRAKHGPQGLAVAVSAGQYKHPQGLFYGGAKPTWSRGVHGRIIADYDIARRRAVAVLDYHTGLGPHGYGELISTHLPNTRAARRNKAWYGDSVTEPLGGTSQAGARYGFSNLLWEDKLGDRCNYVALEYGTYPTDTVVMPALVADHWLHGQKNFRWASPLARKIKAQIRHAFYGDNDPWREAVIFRSRQTIRLALQGLSGR